MPSWNIHTAHVERLLKEEAPERLGIRDVNCFQFGNYVPDIYVGYMVHNTTRRIDYCTTHLTTPDVIPIPQAEEFWQRFVEPSGVEPGGAELGGAEPGRASDICLGAWAHLVADAVYNQATRDYLLEHGLEITTDHRIKKQDDFAAFGRTLSMSRHCTPTKELIEQAQAFPHYSICEADVRAALEVANSIVDDNACAANQGSLAVQGGPAASGTPHYQLLDEGFFATTFERVHEMLISRLRAYAA